MRCPECHEPAPYGFCQRPHPDYSIDRAIDRRDIVWCRGEAQTPLRDWLHEREPVPVHVTGEPSRIWYPPEPKEIMADWLPPPEPPKKRGRPRQVVGKATDLRCERCAGTVVMDDSLLWCEDCAHEPVFA